MSEQHAHVTALYRYPVKGLSPQRQDRLTFAVGEGLANDRRFALALGTTEFDPQNPEPLEKSHFLMLRANESLAALSTHFDERDDTLTISAPGEPPFHAAVGTAEGRAEIEAFFAAYLGKACQGDPRLVEAPGHRFTDVSYLSPTMMKALSVINLASVRDLSERLGQEIDPLRFRANIYLDGVPAWDELGWVDHDVAIGGKRFRGVRVTKRCAAVDVDPATGVRDMKLAYGLMSHYGHPNCGVYLEVIEDGSFGVGAKVICDPPATAAD